MTKHFTLEEFERSQAAARLHIDNRVPAALVPNIRHLCEEVLEPLREHFNEPIYISSGYRCEELNRAVGGVANSQHIRGEAADICPFSLSPGPSPVREGRIDASDRTGRLMPDSHSPEARRKMREWAEWIMDNLHFDQLLCEHSGNSYWIHVSLKREGENRQMARRMKVHEAHGAAFHAGFR